MKVANETPRMISYLVELGKAYRNRYDLHAVQEDFGKCARKLRAAINNRHGNHYRRLQPKLGLFHNFVSMERWVDAADLLKEIMRDLNHIVPHSLPRHDSQYRLKSLKGMASLLSSVLRKAVKSPPAVLEAWEAFRRIISSRMMDVKSTRAELEEEHPAIWRSYSAFPSDHRFSVDRPTFEHDYSGANVLYLETRCRASRNKC